MAGAAAEQHFSFERPGDHFPLLTLRLPYSALQLWWPVGYGDQPLYNLTASLAPGGGSCCGAQQAAECNALCSQQSRWGVSPACRPGRHRLLRVLVFVLAAASLLGGLFMLAGR